MDRKQYLVVGLGRFGQAICETLYENGSEVMALDIDQDRVNECVNFATHAVCTNAMERSNLEELGISNFDVAVVNIGTDIKASGIVTMLLKEMGIETVIAKAQDDIHGMMLKKLGADKVVYPERDMGRRVAHNLRTTNIMDFIEVSPDYSLSEIRPMDKWVGKNLGQLALRAKYGMNILAIKNGDDVDASPSADTIIHEDDILLVMCAEKTLRMLER
ncbi:MAG: TrkA family potassium uptake protein [Clostridia bacterium]|nr:TrkA family potassium uptake protein [Clostridia bacterium]